MLKILWKQENKRINKRTKCQNIYGCIFTLFIHSLISIKIDFSLQIVYVSLKTNWSCKELRLFEVFCKSQNIFYWRPKFRTWRQTGEGLKTVSRGQEAFCVSGGFGGHFGGLMTALQPFSHKRMLIKCSEHF